MTEPIVKYGLTADAAKQYYAQQIEHARQRKREEELHEQLAIEIAPYLAVALAELGSE